MGRSAPTSFPYLPLIGAQGQEEVQFHKPQPGPSAHVYDCLFQSK